MIAVLQHKQFLLQLVLIQYIATYFQNNTGSSNTLTATFVSLHCKCSSLNKRKGTSDRNLNDLLLLRGTATLSPGDQALQLSFPAPPAFSAALPEHALGPERDIEKPV